MKAFIEDSDDDGVGSISDIQSPVPTDKSAATEDKDSQAADHAGLKHHSESVFGLAHNDAFTPRAEESPRPTPSGKCRKTSTGEEIVGTPTKRLERSKTMKTYGKSNRHKTTPFTEIEEGPRRSQSVGTDILSSSKHSRRRSSQTDQTVSTQAWQLPATLQQDFATHEPNAMFPEPSSTVPDNTMTQKQLVEDAIDAFHVPGIVEISVTDSTTQKTNQSSIPWSDYVRTPSGEEDKAATSAEGSVAPLYIHANEHSDLAQGREVTSGTKRKADASQEPDDLDQESEISRTKRRKGKNQNNIYPLNSDEVAIGLPKEMYKPRPSRSRSAVVSNDSIDSSARLEKPSRRTPRRSKTTCDSTTRTVQQSSSEKVEAITAMGFTGSQARNTLQIHNDSIEKAIDQLCRSGSQGTHKSVDDVSFIGQGSVQPLKDMNAEMGPIAEKPPGDGGTTEAENSLLDPPIVAQKQSQTKIKAVLDSEDDEEDDMVVEKPTIFEKPELQHMHCGFDSRAGADKSEDEDQSDEEAAKEMHAKMRRTKSMPVLASQPMKRTKKSRGRPRKDSQAESKDTPNSEDNSQPKPTRGRGRPRKSVETVLDDIDELAEEQVQEDIQDQPKETMETASDTQNANKKPALLEISPNVTVVSPGLQAHSPPSTPSKEAVLSQNDQTQSRNGPDVVVSSTKPKAQSPHSPLTKGKVSYRVGLSRRARIAPLLRIVKK